MYLCVCVCDEREGRGLDQGQYDQPGDLVCLCSLSTAGGQNVSAADKLMLR